MWAPASHGCIRIHNQNTIWLFDLIDVGTEVEIQIDSGSSNIFGRGVVATCHPGVGLGISFLEIYPEYRDEFEALLKNLERRASGDTKVHTLPFPITTE